MRFYTLFGMLALVAGLAACAGGPEQELSAAQPASVGSEAQLDPNSTEYFRVKVGDRVFFATNQSDLSAEARSLLDRQAEWLRVNPEVSITIEGHADERGTREYNLALGARRAQAVQAYLINRGVASGRVRSVTFGRERPVETCSADQCWAQNRRAVTAPN